LNTGAIPANTVAKNGAGGTVKIDSQALIPSFGAFKSGGNIPVPFDTNEAGLNLVQAAAPNGVGGALNVTNPTLNLVNSLVGLAGKPASPTVLSRSACSFKQGSSLLLAGRGGLPSSADDPLWMKTEEGTGESLTREAEPTPTKSRQMDAVALIACR